MLRFRLFGYAWTALLTALLAVDSGAAEPARKNDRLRLAVPARRSLRNASADRKQPPAERAESTTQEPHSAVPAPAVRKAAPPRVTPAEQSAQAAPTRMVEPAKNVPATSEPATSEPGQTGPVTVQADEPQDAASESKQIELTPAMARLRDQVRRTLALYYQRPVNARDHSPWETFHWIIAFNVDAQLHTRGPGGELTNAIGWMCYNNPCRGQRLLALQNGRVSALYGVGLEGHPGQFLAILGQSRVMIDYPLRVDGRSFTVADLVETSKLNCLSTKELTFQLIALSHYLDLDETWKNSAGETWSVPRLIREEISSPIHGSACGGTHRLMGLSYAVRKRQQRGQPVDGEYRRAQVYIDEYQKFTLRMQNPDGSFSTEWFAGRGARPDIDRRVQTTGHILEWMVFSSSQEELLNPRLVQAVDYLSTALLSDVQRQWKIGPLGHALRSLSLYDRRVFKPHDPKAAPEVARRESAKQETSTDGLPAETPAEAPSDNQKTDRAEEKTSAAAVTQPM